jgi:uncharacterized protein YbaA (DUF1428 family)
MRYVDGYVLPVPKKNLEAYRRMTHKAAGFGATTARSSTGSAPARILT